MLTLYHSPRSRSTRMLWLLEELGEPYEVKYVTIRHADGTGARDPNNVHPEGKVPALVHDGKLIMESGAICIYLTDSFPKAGLGPRVGDAKRANYLYWLFTCGGDLEPVLVARMTGSGDTPMQKRAHEQVMARITKALNAGDYLLGDKFSAADIMYGSNIQFLRKEFPADPVYDRYLQRLTARPAFTRAMAKDAG